MKRIEYQYVRPTKHCNGHTNIFINGELFGYYMLNRSPYAVIGENVNLMPRKGMEKHFTSIKQLKKYMGEI